MRACVRVCVCSGGGGLTQLVTCLVTYVCLTADPGGTYVGSRPGPILSWRLNHSRMVVVSYKRKYVQEVLVNRLFKFAQEKVLLGELCIPS